MTKNQDKVAVRGQTKELQAVDDAAYIDPSLVADEAAKAEDVPEKVDDAVEPAPVPPAEPVEETVGESVEEHSGTNTDDADSDIDQSAVEPPKYSDTTAILIEPFLAFEQLMGKSAAVNHQAILRNQRRMMTGLSVLLNHPKPSAFTEAFTAVLELVDEDAKGAFEPNLSLYRGIDALPIDYTQRQAYLTLLTLMTALANPDTRSQKLREIDLNIALPEISYFDKRGYLASYTRRFA